MREQVRLEEAGVAGWLRRAGLAPDGAAVEVTEAGDGNINWVRRATVRSEPPRSYILKQARPALERFPQYQAPTERIVCEARWIERAAAFDREGVCPRVHLFDPQDRVLVLEDLGRAERLDRALARGAEVAAALARLARFLGRVHRGTAGEPGLAERFANGGMQRLHGDHIFALPYREAFPAPPATARRAGELRANAELRARADALYERFLTPRGALVHGDVQAGNVLLPARADDPAAVVLLDAEIAHLGDPAFDVGTLLAHAALPAVAAGRGESARPLLACIFEAWRAGFGECDAAEAPALEDALAYGGLELLRRTIGAARVAAVESDEAGLRVIDAGLAWLLAPADLARLRL